MTLFRKSKAVYSSFVRRVLPVLAALCLLLPAAVFAEAAEDGTLGPCFRVDPSLYRVSWNAEMEMYEVESRTGGPFFAVSPVSFAEIGINSSYAQSLVTILKGGTQNGITFGAEPMERGDFTCLPFRADEQEIYGVLAIGREAMLYAYFEREEDLEAFLPLLDAITETAAQPGSSAEPEAESAGEPVGEDIRGYYTGEILGEKDPDIVLILTPGGYGRLSNSTSSYVFTYTLSGNRIIPDTDEFVISAAGEGRIRLESDMINFTFVRSEMAGVSPDLTGKWSLEELGSGKTHYSSAMLRAAGMSIDFTAYADGSIDWRAVTDSVTDAAQGWGVDENGLFFHNGRNIPCTLDGDRLTMTTSDGITFVFLRQGDLP